MSGKRIAELKSNVHGDFKYTAHVAANTIAYERPGKTGPDTCFLLNDVEIIRVTSTHVILNSGFWRTKLTKRRINELVNQFLECSLVVVQHEGVWYITQADSGHVWDRSTWITFYDGMEIPRKGYFEADGNCIVERDRLRILQKLIKDYMKYITPLLEQPVPQPDNGDCWYCCMRTTSGETWGNVSDNTDHLFEHLKEKYFFGSLVYNAMLYAGYESPRNDIVFAKVFTDRVCLSKDFRKRVVKSVLMKYFKNKLGVAR